MSDLQFEESTHTYRWKGSVVPSVSNIIAPLRGDFSKVDPAVLLNAQRRGTAVHELCELHDHGLLRQDDVPEDLAPYFAGYLKFLATHATQWTHIEEPRYSEEHGYCGTPDRLGLLDNVCVVLDLKVTSRSYAATGVQAAAYRMLYPDQPIVRTFGLRLLKNGKFELKEYPDERDTFRNLLALWKWKVKHGEGI